jgi:hypothetical protein
MVTEVKRKLEVVMNQAFVRLGVSDCAVMTVNAFENPGRPSEAVIRVSCKGKKLLTITIVAPFKKGVEDTICKQLKEHLAIK